MTGVGFMTIYFTIMLSNYFLYKFVQPVIYFIIFLLLIKKAPLAKIEKFIFFTSIPAFLTFIIVILIGKGGIFLNFMPAINDFKGNNSIKLFLESSMMIEWLLCASVVPLRILFNMLKINLKISLILYSINFVLYCMMIIAIISGHYQLL